MKNGDLSRNFFLDVDAGGGVTIRNKGVAPNLETGLPVFSTNTRDEAEQLRVRHCKLMWDHTYVLNPDDRPKGVEDLGRVADLFRATYEKMSKAK